MILNIVLNLILMGPLQHGGLALATSLSALFNAVLLTYFLRKRLGLLGGRKILRATIKMGISASAMGIAIYFCKEAWFNLSDPIGIRITVLLTCISLGILVYALISYLLKNEEWSYLLDIRKTRAK